MPTLPPVIERELRILSRQPRTYVTRAVFAAVPFFFVLGAIMATNGREALGVIAAIAGLMAHFAGGLSVARSIIEERRQGTLPILYLTPLTPLEMIGGKLSAHLAVAFSYLLTLVPPMTISIAVGGVSGSDVATVAAALINSAFCSTTLGMLVGSFAREQGQPVFVAIMAMIILGLVSIPLASYLHVAGAANPAVLLSAFLGSLPLMLAFDASGTQSAFLFPATLVLSHAGAWLMVVAAGQRCIAIARSAGDEPRSFGFFGLPGNESQKRKRSPMDKNPVEWLLARNPGVSRAAWGLFFCVVITTTAAFVILPTSTFVTVLPFFYLAGYAFKLLAFSAGCDFFLRERRSGGMELMLTSMLTASEIRTGAVFGFARPILTAFACSAGIWMCFGVAAIAIAGSSADSIVLMAAIAAVSAMDLVSVLTTSLLSGAEFPSYRKAVGMAWIRGIAAPTVLVVAFRADGGFPAAIAGALIGSAIASWWAWQAITRELEALRKAAPESAFSPAFSHHFTHPSSGTPR